MGMHTNVTGYIKTSDKFRKMKEVHDACVEAGVSLPHEVQTYFQEVSITDGEEVNLEGAPGVTAVKADMTDGFEIDISELQKTYPFLGTIRFTNNY